MAFLNDEIPGLANIADPGSFISPFPSSFNDSAIAALGGYEAKLWARAGAYAYSEGTQIALKQKGVHMGDIRSDWLSQLVSQDAVTKEWKGIFAGVNWPTNTSAAAFESAAVNSGFDIAGGLLSAVPVYGKAIAAVLDVAQYFYNVFKKKTPEERLPLVPLAEYDQGKDEDRCKVVIFPLMEGGDWTRIFWPNLDWNTGWEMLPTNEDKTSWAWGTFGPSGGEPRRTSNAPTQDGVGGGLGFMPGCQKISDVTQLARCAKGCGPTSRMDSIVPVGSFYPATSNVSTGLWEMVRKPGNPDMYKVRSGDLWVAWSQYFDALRQSFLEQWNYAWGKGRTFDEPGGCIDLGKLLSPFVENNGNGISLEGINNRWLWPLMFQKSGKWQPDPNDGRPGCVPEDDRSGTGWWAKGWYSDPAYQAGAIWPPDRCGGSYNQTIRKAIFRTLGDTVLPACEGLKQNQHASLYRTEICAYVRPVDNANGQRYAAFEDTSVPWGGGSGTFGEQLTERCLHAREVLLTRDLRFKIRLSTVDAIDAGYAARLRQSGVTETSYQGSMGLGLAAAPYISEGEDPVPSPGPSGGTPFGLIEATRVPTGGGGGLLLGAAAVAAFAALRGR